MAAIEFLSGDFPPCRSIVMADMLAIPKNRKAGIQKQQHIRIKAGVQSADWISEEKKGRIGLSLLTTICFLPLFGPFALLVGAIPLLSPRKLIVFDVSLHDGKRFRARADEAVYRKFATAAALDADAQEAAEPSALEARLIKWGDTAKKWQDSRPKPKAWRERTRSERRNLVIAWSLLLPMIALAVLTLLFGK